jgi:DNA-binding phage protein
MTSLESMAKVKRVDKSKSLGSPEAIAAYLNSALASGDIIRFTEAIVTAARTEGIANVAYQGWYLEGKLTSACGSLKC